MNSILISIPHYGSKNRKYLFESLTELNLFKKYKLDIHIYCTDKVNFDEFDNLYITQHIFNKNIGVNLTHQHKKLFLNHINDYDYFMYLEDDVLIKESTIDSFIEEQNSLPFPFICGFLRYELKENNQYKFLCDCHPCHSVHRNGFNVVKSNYLINNKKYFEPYNIHQASYILTKNIFHEISKEKYLDEYNNYVGILEGAASNVYYNMGLIKVIPRENLDKLLIRHIPNTYVQKLNYFYTEDSTPNDIKLQTIDLDNLIIVK